MPGYKHSRAWNKIFMTSKRPKLATIVHLVDQLSLKVNLWLKLKEKLTFR